MSNLLVFGDPSTGLLGHKTNIGLVPPSVPPEVDHLSVLSVASNQLTTLVLTTQGELISLPTNQKVKIKEKVISIACGHFHFLALSESGDVYSWSDHQQYGSKNGQLGHNDVLPRSKPTRIQFFDELEPIKICCSFASSFVITKGLELYGFGSGGSYILGNGKSCNVLEPENISDDIQQLWTSPFCHHGFLQKTGGHYQGFGSETYGQLGFGNKVFGTMVPKSIGFKQNSILDFALTWDGTTVLTTKNEIYTAGKAHLNGTLNDKFYFGKVKELKNTKIIAISSGSLYTVLMDANNGFWFYGDPKIRQLIRINSTKVIMKLKWDNYNKNRKSNTITTTNTTTNTNTNTNVDNNNLIENDFKNKNFINTKIKKLISCFHYGTFIIYEAHEVIQDLVTHLKDGKCCDCEISDIPMIKMLIEARTKNSFSNVKDALEKNCSVKEIMCFKHWLYSGTVENIDLWEKPKKFLKIVHLGDNILDDLKLLWENRHENSDFIVYNGKNGQPVPVHKFILYARSGQFREYFNFLDKKMENSSIDFSEKNFNVLEQIFHFLYTGEINIKLIKKKFRTQLIDAPEFYRFSPDKNWNKLMSKKYYDYLHNK
ncbi:regulator of chromosome condensation [Anaeramoeba flamelloides]|uniref:Regulator of chromosome condensation n=1 Tax=Anaeramoeba flamelloides TaxID=1746091 RepID=A0AAV7YBT4_9EUKA|nr:regulator of chromosome condensation [Anaeramoeba flamelloides]